MYILIIGILAGYLIACLITYLNQERLLFYPTVIAHDFIYQSAHPYTEAFLPVDGATLALVHFTQLNPKGVIFYLHGNGDTLQTADFFADRFLRRGYDVVAIDYRGYGKSTGSISNEAALHQDVQIVYDYVRQRYREDQIVIYGHSLGSGLAIQLAATTKPRKLILESAYLSMRDIVAQKVPFIPLFLLKYQLRSDQWIGKVDCPIFLIHGTQDSLIPYDSSVRLQTYATAPTQLFRIDGGGHSDLVPFDAYQRALDQILD